MSEGKNECPYLAMDGVCTRQKGETALRQIIGPYPRVCAQVDSLADCFNTKLDAIEMSDLCITESPHCNYYFTISEVDIEQLRKGKILCNVDEYGIFLRFKSDDEESR